MLRKSQFCRKAFGLDEREDVIQNYSCNWVKTVGTPCNMYITQNYVCVASKVGSSQLKVPFRDVTAVRDARSIGVIPNAVEVSTKAESYWFNGFYPPHGATRLLRPLGQPPPLFLVFDVALEGCDDEKERARS